MVTYSDTGDNITHSDELLHGGEERTAPREISERFDSEIEKHAGFIWACIKFEELWNKKGWRAVTSECSTVFPANGKAYRTIVMQHSVLAIKLKTTLTEK